MPGDLVNYFLYVAEEVSTFYHMMRLLMTDSSQILVGLGVVWLLHNRWTFGSAFERLWT